MAHDPDSERSGLIADGWGNDDIMFRRHVGIDETPVQRLNRLIAERHKLAKAGAATVDKVLDATDTNDDDGDDMCGCCGAYWHNGKITHEKDCPAHELSESVREWEAEGE